MYHDRQDKDIGPELVRLYRTDLEDLIGKLRQLLANLTADNESYTSPRAGDSPFSLGELARLILIARRNRTRHFNKAMLGEPAWDMLLALYVTESSGPRKSVSRLSSMSGAPATTALRWLDYLAKEQLVARSPNPTDKRVEFVMLTDKGRSTLEQYLSETLSLLA